MESLNEDVQKKIYDTSCTCTGSDDQITISAKLFDTTHESYIFSGDLIETIT